MQDNPPKPKKPQKLRARLPRGLGDRNATEIAATRRMTDIIREVYERYGFEPVETPAMEFTDALGKFLPDQDRPNEGVFSFQDDDEQWISLRYDLTAPLARYVAQNWDALPKPYRSYRAGYVFRNEKPGPGRFRQFMQFDADTVGSASPAADAEMCMMAADAMEALGIPRGQYVVKVNNRKVLDGVMESIDLGGDENAGRRLTVLRAIDKYDRLGAEGVKQLLGEGRWDGGEEGKGDFTKGALLTSEQMTPFGPYLGMRPLPNPGQATSEHWEEVFDWWRSTVEDAEIGKQGISELENIAEIMLSAGYELDRIDFDPMVVRGLEYYTGPVFEVELLLDATDDKGRPVRFGSIGGGGRYDGLVSRFRGEPVPATGFSIGVSRLQAALDLIHKDKPQPKAYGPVVVTVFPDKDQAIAAENLRASQSLVQLLREAHIRAELYLGSSKHSISQQAAYANKRNSPCVITQGPDEKAATSVTINDLISGAGLTEIADRDEYLRRKAESLETVVVSDLVDAVRKVLAKHDVKWG